MPQDKSIFKAAKIYREKSDTKRPLFCKHESELLTDRARLTAVKNLRL